MKNVDQLCENRATDKCQRVRHRGVYRGKCLRNEGTEKRFSSAPRSGCNSLPSGLLSDELADARVPLYLPIFVSFLEVSFTCTMIRRHAPALLSCTQHVPDIRNRVCAFGNFSTHGVVHPDHVVSVAPVVIERDGRVGQVVHLVVVTRRDFVTSLQTATEKKSQSTT